MRARRKRKMRRKADLSLQLKVHGDVALSGPQVMQLCSASMQSRRRLKSRSTRERFAPSDPIPNFCIVGEVSEGDQSSLK